MKNGASSNCVKADKSMTKIQNIFKCNKIMRFQGGKSCFVQLF